MIEIRIRIYGDEPSGDNATALAVFARLEQWRREERLDFELDYTAIPRRRRRPKLDAATFLIEQVFDPDAGRMDPHPRNDLMARAAERSIPQASMYEARRRLQMRIIRQGKGRPVLWGPPGSDADPFDL